MLYGGYKFLRSGRESNSFSLHVDLNVSAELKNIYLLQCSSDSCSNGKDKEPKQHHFSVCMYAHGFLCMRVNLCMCGCRHVYFVCMYVWIVGGIHAWMDGCMYACLCNCACVVRTLQLPMFEETSYRTDLSTPENRSTESAKTVCMLKRVKSIKYADNFLIGPYL